MHFIRLQMIVSLLIKLTFYFLKSICTSEIGNNENDSLLEFMVMESFKFLDNAKHLLCIFSKRMT